jgi:subtilisin family serine protease
LDEGILEEEDKTFTYHGSHCAGSIAAVDNDQGVVGVAPEAFLYSARMFLVLGGGAVIMSVMGFIIGRKDPSSALSALLFINGGLIIAGLIALIGQGALASNNSSSAARTTIGSTLGLGAILLGLGIWKVMLDKKIVVKRR